MVGDFILYLALIQLYICNYGDSRRGMYLIYQSVLNRSPDICDGVDKFQHSRSTPISETKAFQKWSAVVKNQKPDVCY